MDRFDGGAGPDGGAAKSLTAEGAKRSDLALSPSSKPDAPKPRPILAYVSYAAMTASLLGFGWAAGSHLFGPGGPFAVKQASKPAAAQAIVSQESLDRAEIVRSTRKMAEDLRLMKSDFDSLRGVLAQNAAAKDQHAIEKSVDGLKARLDAAKAETAAAIADLAGKVDRLQREPAARLADIAERLDRIERQTTGQLTTGSIAASPAKTTPSPAPLNRAQAERPAIKPQNSAFATKEPALITSWVVRDAYDGLALVESARGSIEVARGETIPGAGTVKSIERRGDGWIVITSRGLIDSARDNLSP